MPSAPPPQLPLHFGPRDGRFSPILAIFGAPRRPISVKLGRPTRPILFDTGAQERSISVKLEAVGEPILVNFGPPSQPLWAPPLTPPPLHQKSVLPSPEIAVLRYVLPPSTRQQDALHVVLPTDLLVKGAGDPPPPPMALRENATADGAKTSRARTLSGATPSPSTARSSKTTGVPSDPCPFSLSPTARWSTVGVGGRQNPVRRSQWISWLSACEVRVVPFSET